MPGKRIARTTVAVAKPEPLPWWKELAHDPVARKVATFIIGAALGAACRALPPAAQPACEAATRTWHFVKDFLIP